MKSRLRGGLRCGVVLLPLGLAGQLLLADDPYGRLPLRFEANLGQTDPQVRFLARGRGYGVFVTTSGVVAASRGGLWLRMRMANANPRPEIAGQDPLPGKSNYFLGHNPGRWRTNIPHFARVHYRQVYPGVDLVCHGNQGRLQYDFVIAPGADLGVIRLAYEGAQQILVDRQGDLILKTAAGEIKQSRPVVYQETGAGREIIEGRYVRLANNQIGFRVSRYDAGRPLVIDPIVNYSSYLGGSGDDAGNAIALDPSGNIYVAGTTSSPNFPKLNPLQGSLRTGPDAFVVKLNPTGSALIYATYLGGDDRDSASAITVDASGNAYLTGATLSSNFPTANAFQGASGAGYGDAFVTKLNSTGTALVYSTYLGGRDADSGAGIAVDGGGNAYVVGSTSSDDFPTLRPIQAKLAPGTCGVFGARPCNDLLVTKFNSSGSGLVYSTYLGGSGNDLGGGIAVDSSGNAYVTGSSASTNFPTANPLQASMGGTRQDAVVLKLNAAGSALLYSTYLGGSGADSGYAIAVDASGNAYVTGSTESANFPTANPVQRSKSGAPSDSDAFVAKINAAGSALVYSTYLGGSNSDYGYGIAVDGSGSATVAGATYSLDFPRAAALQNLFGGGSDAFITKFNATGSAMLFSSYLGGSSFDEAHAVALDASGNPVLIGQTRSQDFFTTLGALQPGYGGGGLSSLSPGDAFVAKIGGLGDAGAGLAILSAASFNGLALAPESFASAFGQGLATGTRVAESVPLPESLAGTTVTVTDSASAQRPAGLFFVSPGQINFLLPRETRPGPATITITSGDGRANIGTALIHTVAPGLFSANADARGVAAAMATRVKADGSQSSELVFDYDAAQARRVAKPVDLGAPADQVILTLFGTGIRFRSSLSAVKVRIGDQDCEVLYAGPQGEFAGLDQVNVRLPRTLFAQDDLSIVMMVDGKPANVVTVSIAGKPKIASLAPAAARAGETIANFTINGAYLEGVSRIDVSPGEGITVTNLSATATTLTARLTIAPDARPGERDVLVVSPVGPSNKLVFLLRPAPGSPEPLIYNVTLKFPAAEGTKATITGSFDFEDASGDILFTGAQQGSAGIHYYIVNGCSLTFSGSFLNRRGETSGKVSFNVSYDWSKMIFTFLGDSNQFWLTDAAGNRSNIIRVGSQGGLCP